jgi:hypothetical protein
MTTKPRKHRGRIARLAAKAARTQTPPISVADEVASIDAAPIAVLKCRIDALESRYNVMVDACRWENSKEIRLEIIRLEKILAREKEAEEKRERERMAPCSTEALAPKPQPARIAFESGALCYVVLAEDERGYKRLVIHKAEMDPANAGRFAYGVGGAYGVDVHSLRNLNADK